MNQMKKKLHSNSGASMILALALMLICVMVSSVIIVAAASGIDRNKERMKREQEYLAVTSAAKYIAENLNSVGSDRFNGVQLKNEAPCFKYKNYRLESNIRANGTYVDAYAVPSQNILIEANEPGLVSVEQFYLYVKDTDPTTPAVDIFCHEESTFEVVDATTSFSGVFAELMRDAAETVFMQNVAYSNEFTIKVDDSRIPEVKCKFNMDEDYNVTVTVQSMNVESEYYMIVQMPTYDLEVNPAGWRTMITCTHRGFYEYCNNVGNILTSNIKEYTLKHEIDNPTTTVTWEKPVIIKGGNVQ